MKASSALVFVTVVLFKLVVLVKHQERRALYKKILLHQTQIGDLLEHTCSISRKIEGQTKEQL